MQEQGGGREGVLRPTTFLSFRMTVCADFLRGASSAFFFFLTPSYTQSSQAKERGSRLPVTFLFLPRA